MADRKREAEDILSAFAIEPVHDRATLDRYLREHPDLVAELLDLSLELELHDPAEGNEEFAFDTPSIDAAWERFSRSATTVELTPKSFTAQLADVLGTKLTVIMALRDRRVAPASVTPYFLDRLAAAVSRAADDVRNYLAGPQTLPAGASFKSNSKPKVSERIPLDLLLRQCGHTEEEIARLLGVDQDGRN